MDPSNPSTITWKESLEDVVEQLLSPSGRLLSAMPLAEQCRAMGSVIVCHRQRLAGNLEGVALGLWLEKLRVFKHRLHLRKESEARESEIAPYLLMNIN